MRGRKGQAHLRRDPFISRTSARAVAAKLTLRAMADARTARLVRSRNARGQVRIRRGDCISVGIIGSACYERSLKWSSDKAGDIMVRTVAAGAVNATVPHCGAARTPVGGGVGAGPTWTCRVRVNNAPEGDGGVKASQAIGAIQITRRNRGLRNGRSCRRRVSRLLMDESAGEETVVGVGSQPFGKDVGELLVSGHIKRLEYKALHAISEFVRGSPGSCACGSA